MYLWNLPPKPELTPEEQKEAEKPKFPPTEPLPPKNTIKTLTLRGVEGDHLPQPPVLNPLEKDDMILNLLEKYLI